MCMRERLGAAVGRAGRRRTGRKLTRRRAPYNRLRNALSQAMIGEILEALEEIRADDELQAVITRGLGPAYSAGADLNDLRALHQEAPHP